MTGPGERRLVRSKTKLTCRVAASLAQTERMVPWHAVVERYRSTSGAGPAHHTVRDGRRHFRNVMFRGCVRCDLGDVLTAECQQHGPATPCVAARSSAH